MSWVRRVVIAWLRTGTIVISRWVYNFCHGYGQVIIDKGSYHISKLSAIS